MSESITDTLTAFEEMVQSLIAFRQEKFVGLVHVVQAVAALEESLNDLESKVDKLARFRRSVSKTDVEVRSRIATLEGDVRSVRHQMNSLTGTVGGEFDKVARFGRHINEVVRKRTKTITALETDASAEDVSWNLQNYERELDFTMKDSESWIKERDPLSREVVEIEGSLREQGAKINALLKIAKTNTKH